MPIYEYHCKACQRDFEALVWSSNDEASLSCTHCGSKELERILSLFATACSSSSKGLSTSGCGPSSGGFS